MAGGVEPGPPKPNVAGRLNVEGLDGAEAVEGCPKAFAGVDVAPNANGDVGATLGDDCTN